TDLVFSAVVTGVGSILYLSAGLVNVPLSLMLLGGSIPGVIIGSRISIRLGDRFLRPAICSILFFVGLRTI
ncbi:MAG: sulfite exporter TauE/SafE family protein, partial [Candidatus Eremiobacteraeota bacterium]|nr:sulfite exporter TauE/SafE family protein [Candidatus Eremiobacteraeota bacterium]